MHGNVDAAVQQGVVNLLGEEALAADVGQGLVQNLVASGLDDDDVQGALLGKLGESGLQGFEKQRGGGGVWRVGGGGKSIAVRAAGHVRCANAW